MKKDYSEVLDRHTRDEWECLIYQRIFNARDRKMLTWRLLDGMLYEQIADALDNDLTLQPLSVQQIKKRLYKAQNRLFK